MSTPALVGVRVDGCQRRVRRLGVDHGEIAECGVVVVDAGANCGAARRALGAVGVVQLDGGAGGGGERCTEQGAEKQVGSTSADGDGIHSHLAHHFETVGESKCDPLLGGAHQVTLIVAVEAQAMYRRPRIAVTKHPLGAVAERQHHHPVRANRHLTGLEIDWPIVALVVARAAQPTVQDAAAVQAQQHAVARVSLPVVDVHEGVHARGGVVVGAVGHAVDHAGGAGGGGHRAGIEHPEGERVVGLVAAPVGERRADRQAQLGGGRRGKPALCREGGQRPRQQRRVDAVVVEQKIGPRRA